jgi:zinc protease
VAAPATAAAVKELLAEVARIRDADVTEEELADAKEWIARAVPARFETLTDVTSALADLAIHDLPLDEYATWPARIAAVTAADVRRAANAHLHPAKIKVVVVGDRATIAAPLGELGLGPPEARGPFGDPDARPR